MMLDELAKEIRSRLIESDTAATRAGLCALVSEALRDETFVSNHLTDRAPGQPAREILYQDPDLGFCICGHVHDGPGGSKAHDHGPSWAIYGQAVGRTEMTDWCVVDPGGDGKPILVKPERRYMMEAGDAFYFDIHAIHSPDRKGPGKLIRIEGANLDTVQRSNIREA